MNNRIVLYDGLCGLCDGVVRFLLKIDGRGALLFAPLQGSTAAAVAARHPSLATSPESVVFVIDFDTPAEKIFTQSDAVLRILIEIGRIWKAAAVFRLIPRFIRNQVYGWVAAHRAAWFGTTSQCQVPSDQTRARFLS